MAAFEYFIAPMTYEDLRTRNYNVDELKMECVFHIPGAVSNLTIQQCIDGEEPGAKVSLKPHCRPMRHYTYFDAEAEFYLFYPTTVKADFVTDMLFFRRIPMYVLNVECTDEDDSPGLMDLKFTSGFSAEPFHQLQSCSKKMSIAAVKNLLREEKDLSVWSTLVLPALMDAKPQANFFQSMMKLRETEVKKRPASSRIVQEEPEVKKRPANW